MRKMVVCACSAIISISFLVFWIVMFIQMPSLSQVKIDTIKIFEYINIGFVVTILLIFSLLYKITFDKLADNSIKSNPTLDRIFYGGIFFVFIAVLVFEMIVAFYCNINALYLSDAENIKFFHLPWLILANCALCFACYVVYQYYRTGTQGTVSVKTGT